MSALRYNDVWTDWRTTSFGDAGQEKETVDLATGEDITSSSSYSEGYNGITYSLRAETSAGRQWGPFGDHSGYYYDVYSGSSLRSSPPISSGLRLHHLSGDQSVLNRIIRWNRKKGIEYEADPRHAE